MDVVYNIKLKAILLYIYYTGRSMNVIVNLPVSLWQFHP